MLHFKSIFYRDKFTGTLIKTNFFRNKFNSEMYKSHTLLLSANLLSVWSVLPTSNYHDGDHYFRCALFWDLHHYNPASLQCSLETGAKVLGLDWKMSILPHKNLFPLFRVEFSYASFGTFSTRLVHNGVVKRAHSKLAASRVSIESRCGNGNN